VDIDGSEEYAVLVYW